MAYFISFLEGILTFISPCLLPMLPIYISYFAGGSARSTGKTLRTAAGFVLGFTVLFVCMGALAGTIGSFLRMHQGAVNLISGAIVILFGLNFLGVIRLNLFRGSSRSMNTNDLGFFSAFLFGVIFSVGWTPCVGAFLGSALMLATSQGNVLEGVLMLLLYSLGLGIPFFKLTAEATGGSFSIDSTLGVGTTTTAFYHTGHIDMMPVGDMVSTMVTLISMNPKMDFVYRHTLDGREFVLDTREIKAVLEDVPIDSPEVVLFIRDSLTEGEEELKNPETVNL